MAQADARMLVAAAVNTSSALGRFVAKVALVTRASSGIRLEVARHHARSAAAAHATLGYDQLSREGKS